MYKRWKSCSIKIYYRFKFGTFPFVFEMCCWKIWNVGERQKQMVRRISHDKINTLVVVNVRCVCVCVNKNRGPNNVLSYFKRLIVIITLIIYSINNNNNNRIRGNQLKVYFWIIQCNKMRWLNSIPLSIPSTYIHEMNCCYCSAERLPTWNQRIDV